MDVIIIAYYDASCLLINSDCRQTFLVYHHRQLI
jgi:hypothetical protein